MPRRSTSLRIALSGSAGTGKTTLARRLASDLSLPYVPEGMRVRIERGLDLHALGPEQLQGLVLELWEEQCQLEDQAERSSGGFVSDRSPIDFFAFWLLYRCGPRAHTESFHREVGERAARLDRIVVLPWGVIPLEDDGVRSVDPWRQKHYQALLEGLLFRESRPEQLVWIEGVEKVADRAAAVARTLSPVTAEVPVRP